MHRPPVRARLLILLAALALSLAGAGTADAGWKRYLAPRSVCPNQTSPSATAAQKVRAMRCMANWARKKRGLGRLSASSKLDRAGRLKLRDESSCNEFSHTACGKPFLSVFRRSGYINSSTRGYAVGENLAWGQGSYGLPRWILFGWLRSDGHRHNLFSTKWRQMGVAYRFDTEFVGYHDAALWANEFGHRG